MSVEKNPNGPGYRVRWRESSGQQRSKTVRLWRDAVALDGDLKRKRAMGELIAHEKGATTCEDFWLLWRQQYGAVALSPRTLVNYDVIWRKHLRPILGRSPLRSVSRESVAALVAKLNLVMSPGSVHKAVTVLQSMFARAVEWGYVAGNPTLGVRKPPAPKSVGRALTSTDLCSLLTEMPSLRDRCVTTLLSATGMRPGELRAIRWEDLLGSGSVSISKAASSNQVGTTKTGHSRSVPLSTEAQRALTEWSVACGRPRVGLIFPGGHGRLWGDSSYRNWQQRIFTPAASRAGLGGLRPYDLRHTYASRRIAAGANIVQLAAEMGHSATVLLSVYAHLIGGESVYSERTDQLGSDRITNEHGA